MPLAPTLSNNMSEQVGTDRALIDQARASDEVALRALIERYEPQVAATVVGMLGPGDEADDVGQETFVRFYQSLDKFRGDAALGTYLTRIAINLSLNALERRKRQRWRFWSRDDEQAPPEPSVDGRNEQAASEREQAVQAALDQLKPAFQGGGGVADDRGLFDQGDGCAVGDRRGHGALAARARYETARDHPQRRGPI